MEKEKCTYMTFVMLYCPLAAILQLIATLNMKHKKLE